MKVDPDIVLRAISVAARAHEGQNRKDGLTPYIAHPLRVMTILATRFGIGDPEVLATAALHDPIEDTTVDRDELIEGFGARVALWVAELSKDKRLPEHEREQAYFNTLTHASIEVKLCKLADALDNLLDSAALSPEIRQKAIGKAVDLVAAFEPGLPAEWKHVLIQLQDQIQRLQESQTPKPRHGQAGTA